MVVEHGQLDPGAADITATGPTGQIVIGNRRDGDFAFELPERDLVSACEVGIQLPAGVKTRNPDSHQARIKGVVRGQENNVLARPRGQLQTEASFFQDSG